MSPLAHGIVKELTLPTKRREFVDKGGLLPRMKDIHCFDMSAVARQLMELSTCVLDHWRPGRLAFLPAERTWIEMRRPLFSEGRIGFLLERMPHGWARMTAASEVCSFSIGRFALHEALLALQDKGLDAIVSDVDFPGAKGPHAQKEEIWSRAHAFMAMAFGSLLLINHPRSIGRSNHPAHAGLSRNLKASIDGQQYHLHPWTEINLQVRLPPDTAVGGEDTVLTGERAYHWVRAYLRVSTGTPVLDYWRGNPELGIVQSRYKVTPPKVGKARAA